MGIVINPFLITLESIEKLKQLESSLPYGDAKGAIKAAIHFLEHDDLQTAKDVLNIGSALVTMLDSSSNTYTEIVECLKVNQMLPIALTQP